MTMVATKGIYECQRRPGQSFVGAYMRTGDKRKLAAAAELRGTTLTRLLQDVAENALIIAAILPASGNANRGAQELETKSAAVATS